MALRLLLVAAEYRPLLKVGGLADVIEALPDALVKLGHDVRVLLPRVRGMPQGRRCARLPGIGTLHEAVAAPRFKVWMLDAPALRRRSGIYADANGAPYADDAACFADLCRAAVALADDACGLRWRADVVHCHEWQTGLVPPLLQLARVPAASVFTIHNLAQRGLFPPRAVGELGLPAWLMHPDALEFWGQCAFIKGGLQFADRLTTVSPRYAKEILTPAFGEGLDGALRARGERLVGILNGLDEALWNPRTDPSLPAHFSSRTLRARQRARAALLQELGVREPRDEMRMLLGFVGRLVPQKGIDLVLDALPALLQRPLCLIVLGSGEAATEARLRAAALAQPDRLLVHIGFDEALAHRIYAGIDAFLMPSRFEPCGLSQLSAMRYGAPPIVNPVGGLVDTVVDATPQHLADGRASGFAMRSADAAGLVDAVDRALALRADTDAWMQLARQAMERRFSWRDSAKRYVEVYEAALAARTEAYRRAPPLRDRGA
ncbi:MAG TPA: glycogen synthase GlgA [Mizugakiibacter sp.]